MIDMEIYPSSLVRYLLAWNCVGLKYVREEGFVHGCDRVRCVYVVAQVLLVILQLFVCDIRKYFRGSLSRSLWDSMRQQAQDRGDDVMVFPVLSLTGCGCLSALSVDHTKCSLKCL